MTLSIVATPAPLRTDADGNVRVGRTRVTLDTVVEAFLEGATAEEIVQQYTSLSLADVYSVIGYYLRQRPAVDAYLEQNRQEADIIRQKIEAHPDMSSIRERLLARRAGSQA